MEPRALTADGAVQEEGESDIEMHVDEEGRPRFNPAKPVVGKGK